MRMEENKVVAISLSPLEGCGNGSPLVPSRVGKVTSRSARWIGARASDNKRYFFVAIHVSRASMFRGETVEEYRRRVLRSLIDISVLAILYTRVGAVTIGSDRDHSRRWRTWKT